MPSQSLNPVLFTYRASSNPDFNGLITVFFHNRVSSLSCVPVRCEEALRRRGSEDDDPLEQAYIISRLDTDDPLEGYMLRTREECWLQVTYMYMHPLNTTHDFYLFLPAHFVRFCQTSLDLALTLIVCL